MRVNILGNGVSDDERRSMVERLVGPGTDSTRRTDD
jgi:hypothetical protein